jgi:hypothetical protein
VDRLCAMTRTATDIETLLVLLILPTHQPAISDSVV